MKILFTAGREEKYVRNTVIINSLKRFFDISLIIDNSKNVFIRYLRTYFKILRKKRNYQLAFVGFFGTPFMVFGPLLFRTKIIFDAFVFSYDTICFDRKLVNPESILGKGIFYIDKISFSNADHILVETNENKLYLQNTFHIPAKKISPVFVSCDENLFFVDEQSNSKNIILFYSTYQPLHGTQNIIKAASLVQDFSDIQFHIYGKGQELVSCKQLARNLGLQNLLFFDYVEYSKLPKIIASAKICLAGPFGNTPKAKRVITGKTYQYLYMRKPTIVTRTNANSELLTHNWDAEFCEIANPESLANSINILISNPDYMNKIAQNGYNTYMNKASNSIISSQIKEIVDSL